MMSNMNDRIDEHARLHVTLLDEADHRDLIDPGDDVQDDVQLWGGLFGLLLVIVVAFIVWLIRDFIRHG